MRALFVFIIALSASAIPFILYTTSAFGALTIQPTTTLDNANRRMYTWCPLNSTDISSFNGEINGCPTVRVYVYNWSQLTVTQQQTVDKILTVKGFVDAGQNPSVK